MNGEQYREAALKFVAYPESVEGEYLLTALIGEIGEVANQVKKIMRDDNGELNPERREKLIDELGDVCWYMAVLSVHLNTHAPEYNIKPFVLFNALSVSESIFYATRCVGEMALQYISNEVPKILSGYMFDLEFYINSIMGYLEVSQHEIFDQNINKLLERAAKNTIKGDQRAE